MAILLKKENGRRRIKLKRLRLENPRKTLKHFT